MKSSLRSKLKYLKVYIVCRQGGSGHALAGEAEEVGGAAFRKAQVCGGDEQDE